MKFLFLLPLLFLSRYAAIAQALPIELQTPEIVSVNRMPMRATAFAYENKALAEKRVKEQSAFFLSLNGSWKFSWVQTLTTGQRIFIKQILMTAGGKISPFPPIGS